MYQIKEAVIILNNPGVYILKRYDFWYDLNSFPVAYKEKKLHFLITG